MRALAIILSCTLIVLASGYALFTWQHDAQLSAISSPLNGTSAGTSSLSASTSTTSSPTLSIASSTPSAPGMKRFFDQPHHFTLEYPQNFQQVTIPTADSSLMVAFKDSSTGEGFQVYAVPYDEPKITAQRFKLDEPSGIMNDPVNLMVERVPATSFYSKSQAMGNTFEIWFINRGILYEVTTFKSLDISLMQIMQSWRFVQ